MLRAAAFIEPCLPSPADKPPSGTNWIHEIKHDGYRLMARRDPVGIRLLTRGFETLAGARQCAREKGLPAWDIFHGNVRVEYHDPR